MRSGTRYINFYLLKLSLTDLSDHSYPLRQSIRGFLRLFSKTVHVLCMCVTKSGVFVFLRNVGIILVNKRTLIFRSICVRVWQYILLFLYTLFKYWQRTVTFDNLFFIIIIITVFWDIEPCSVVEIDRRFSIAYSEGCHIYISRCENLIVQLDLISSTLI